MSEVGAPESAQIEIRGVTINYRRKGQGSPVLVLHGEDTAGQWWPFYDQLVEQFDVLVPEQPGFGRSGEPAWLTRMHDLMLFQSELLDAFGLERVAVVGESFGGWLGAELAVTYPERIERLALLAPLGIKPAGVRMPDLFVLNPEQWASAMFADPEVQARWAERRPTREELERQLRDRATLSRLGWNPYLHDPELPKWLDRVRGPVLLVWGEQDQFLPKVVAQAWTERLPQARLETVPGAGHLVGAERPGEVGHMVAEFLRSGR